jgi:hypothetical protein
MTNETTYNSFIIGAIENNLVSLIADRLSQCEYLYSKGAFVLSTIKCAKDILTTEELKALVSAKMIAKSKSNLIVFNATISAEVVEIAEEDGLSITAI